MLLERGVWAISNGKDSCLLKRLGLRLLYCNFNVKINKGYVGSDSLPFFNSTSGGKVFYGIPQVFLLKLYLI